MASSSEQPKIKPESNAVSDAAPARSAKSENEFSLTSLLDASAMLILRIGVGLSFVPMVGCLMMGVVKMGDGICTFFGWWDCTKDQKLALAESISGLEFFMLAPLAFLLLRSLAQYVDDLDAEEEVRVETRQCFLDSKAHAAGLLFAVIATHLTGKFLTKVEGGLGREEVQIGAIMLAVLGIFFFGVEVLSHGLAKHKK